MPIYFGNKNISDISFGDKSIAEVYYGDKLVFQKDQFTGWLYTVAGSDTEVVLDPGNWVAVTRGGGGSGGEDGKNGSWTGGSGGAGGKGELTFYPFTLQYLSKMLVHVGEPGLTVANGGNGGTGGTPQGAGKAGGNGGGGGKPSYIADNYEKITETLYGYKSEVTSISALITTRLTQAGGEEKNTVSFSRDPSGDYIENEVQYYKWVYKKGDLSRVDDVLSVGYTTSLSLSKDDTLLNVVTKVRALLGNPRTITYNEGNKTISFVNGGGDIVFTGTEEPSVGDTVYSDWDTPIGTISTIREDGIVLITKNSEEYIRYSEADKNFTRYSLIKVLTYADGGGGGGGGGGCPGGPSRRAGGGAGGGGGGYYQVETIGEQTNIISVPGKTGGAGANYYQYGSAGQNGRTTGGGSEIKAGDGGGGSHYQTGKGGTGGTGFGASGGGGNAGDRNNHTHESAKGGAGGGGAGGSLDASGGGIQVQTWGTVATTGSNYHTAPTDTLADNIKYAGVNDTYGIGGTANTNGTGGFVLINKVYTLTLDVTPSDASVTMTTIGFTQSGNTINVMAGQDVEIILKKAGYVLYRFKKTIKKTQTLSVTMEPFEDLDMGSITGTVEQTIDCGTITGSVTETINAGDIYEQTIPTA